MALVGTLSIPVEATELGAGDGRCVSLPSPLVRQLPARPFWLGLPPLDRAAAAIVTKIITVVHVLPRRLKPTAAEWRPHRMARTRANACGGDPMTKGKRALSPEISDAGRHAIVIAENGGGIQAQRPPRVPATRGKGLIVGNVPRAWTR
jgi:hypothetical protein